MDLLHPRHFFDLSHYTHAALFSDSKLVWEAIIRIQDYLDSCDLGNIEVTVPDGVYFENPHLISIGKGTVLEPGVYIKGPCIIGDECTVRQGAYIRGNFIAGNYCVIGHATEVKDSIFLDNTLAGHFAYVGNSILGNKVNVGAGTKFANLRFDNQPVTIAIEGKKIQTGARKLGAILGDGAQTGCNSVTNPGTLFGKNSSCYPCVNVGGYIGPNLFIKPNYNNEFISTLSG